MINSSSYRIYHIQTENSVAVHNQLLTPVRWQQLLSTLTQGNIGRIILHIAACLTLYFIPVILFLFINASPYFIFLKSENLVYLFSFALVVLFSYLNYYWLVPGFFIQKKFLVYFSVVTIFIITITALQYFAEATLLPAETTLFQFEGGHATLSGVSYTFILLAVSTLSSVVIRLCKELKTAQTAVQHAKSSILNNQINPHFLFNSLNWIYFLAIEESEQTPDAIIQLSGLMRHVLKAPGADFIDLRKELSYINNYLSLQKGRLGDTLSLHCSLPVYKGKGKIAPLLLMSFIENAFKHGLNPDEDSAINIDVSIVNDMLCLQVINNIVSRGANETSNGVGIENAKQRLNALYPSMHKLEILEDNKIYSVKLSIAIL